MELQQLLKECKKQSITAQKYLYDRFAVQLYLVCRRYLKTNEQAEEILHNGFLKIFTGLLQFNYTTDAAFIAWLNKIMINECLMDLRKKNNFLLVTEDEAENIIVDELIENKLNADTIYTLITQLPIGYRTVFNLYCIEGYSHNEIAIALNISGGTSKSQLNKARKMLQQLIVNNESYENRKAK
ncbi:MAG: sigma-70 family RNA polymerase sigma factor [Bacteroidetes bacterium]|nr:sigma-70 family RNA polymerase sigma factor [Bacteroidota bacterium]MBS1641009.1 sigma-70 family RNA polymerase sigma factor [Bacteroidota bacterium]MBS1672065.1 sigma-70 family RNA polymerase sigma factor [Bacteroidota bacterium]